MKRLCWRWCKALLSFYLFVQSCSNYEENIYVTLKSNSICIINDSLILSYTVFNESNTNIYLPINPLLLTGVSLNEQTIKFYP